MWTIYIYTRNAVYTENALFAENDLEEEASSVGDSDAVGDDDTNDEILLDIGIGSARNGQNIASDDEEKDQESDLDDLVVLEQNMNQIFNSTLLEMMNKADERKSRMLNEDSMYQSIGLQSLPLVNKNITAREVDDFVLSPHSMIFSSQKSSSYLRGDKTEVRSFNHSWAGGRSPQKISSWDLHSRSLFGANHSIHRDVGSNGSNKFILPKRNRMPPPQRVVAESGYKSDDSSSSGGSAVELNAIFDNFFNSDAQKHDDNSVEDYQMMMSTFNFKDNYDDDDDIGVDNSSDNK
jgi:hypothetical protein